MSDSDLDKITPAITVERIGDKYVGHWYCTECGATGGIDTKYSSYEQATVANRINFATHFRNHQVVIRSSFTRRDLAWLASLLVIALVWYFDRAAFRQQIDLYQREIVVCQQKIEQLEQQLTGQRES